MLESGYGDPLLDYAEIIKRKDIEIERLRTQVNSLIREISEFEIRNSYLQNRIKALEAGY